MSVASWEFLTNHVDPNAMKDDSGQSGNYISAESILLAAGPASYGGAAEASMDLVPIGVCDTVQLLQNKGVIQLYEIGSRIPYILPGRPVVQLQISRVLFNGDTLLAALTKRSGADPGAYDDNVIGMPGTEFETSNSDNAGQFYLNLASHFFNQPFGLGLFFKDSEDEWVAGFYAENCVIQQHSMAIQGQNMIVMENASVRCTGLPPMEGGIVGTTPS